MDGSFAVCPLVREVTPVGVNTRRESTPLLSEMSVSKGSSDSLLICFPAGFVGTELPLLARYFEEVGTGFEL